MMIVRFDEKQRFVGQTFRFVDEIAQIIDRFRRRFLRNIISDDTNAFSRRIRRFFRRFDEMFEIDRRQIQMSIIEIQGGRVGIRRRV